MFILVLNLVPYTQTSTKIDTSQVIANTLLLRNADGQFGINASN
jgi:hypothetical protein